MLCVHVAIIIYVLYIIGELNFMAGHHWQWVLITWSVYIIYSGMENIATVGGDRVITSFPVVCEF